MPNLQYVFCVLLFVGTIPAYGQEREEKVAVPTKAAQAEATKVIKEVYGDEYSKAETPTEKQALAHKLLEKANESKDDPAAQFVLLRLARDIAVQGNDEQTASQAIDAMAELFAVDAKEMKLAVLTKFAATAVKPEQHTSVAKEALRQMEKAVGDDNFKVADQLGKLALAEAKTARDNALLVHAQGLVSEVGELDRLYLAAETAKAKLATTPDDSEANLTVGKYLCLVKGDWDKGLPLFASAKDDVFSPLAKQELAMDDRQAEKESAISLAKFGDAWWNVAEKQEGRRKKQIQAHAAHWYRLAPGLTGLTKDKVEKRLNEVDSIQAQVLLTDGTSVPVANSSGSLLSTNSASLLKTGSNTIVGQWAWSNVEVVDFRPTSRTLNSGLCTTTLSTNKVGYWVCSDNKLQTYRIIWAQEGHTWAEAASRRPGEALSVKSTDNNGKWIARRIQGQKINLCIVAPSIVGKWKGGTNGAWQVEFKQDGSCGERGASWKLVNPNARLFYVNWPKHNNSNTITVSLDGSAMLVRVDKGSDQGCFWIARKELLGP